MITDAQHLQAQRVAYKLAQVASRLSPEAFRLRVLRGLNGIGASAQTATPATWASMAQKTAKLIRLEREALQAETDNHGIGCYCHGCM